MSSSVVDPRTPVVVGVGQQSERVDDTDYRGLSPVELAAEAARQACGDAAAVEQLASLIDTVVGIRQFEISTPGAPAPFGRSDNVPRSVAARLGAEPERAVLEVTGGQAPQKLVNEWCETIASGAADTVLIVGAEAISTVRQLSRNGQHRDWSETVDGQLDDRGYGLAGVTSRYQLAHQLDGAVQGYALAEHARRARLRLSRPECARRMGELFAPFTRVAAGNPHAAAPIERSPDELVTVTESNRMISDPYPRLIVSRDQVNQAAALLLTSVGTAERAGIPEHRWVYLHGYADVAERTLLERADLGASPAAILAASAALDAAGAGVDDMAAFDLYSCFPVAVFNVCDGLGLDPADSRGLSVTGGLPFFGGPGNNYSTHAIATMVQRLRAEPGSMGFVGANGGVLGKYSAGVYSTTPRTWSRCDSAPLQAEIDALPAPAVVSEPDGAATIETYTVLHRRRGPVGIVVGRLHRTGERFLATAADADTVDRLGGQDEPLGAPIAVRSFGFGNRFAFSERRLTQLFPPRPPAFRDSYEHVVVERRGHLLEATINRPSARNALHPMANEELDAIFDAYLADDDLWVAILTGAGTDAFCTGNDLKYGASGEPVWVPKNGFAGLTSRRGRDKPVLAAVNGYALGGGLEIALACDLVIADEKAQFALSEVRVGLAAAAGGLVRLPRQIGKKAAMELVLTGRRIGAEQAQELGIVNRTVPAGEALDGARELAEEILAASPTSVRASLQLVEQAEAFPSEVEAARNPSSALDRLLVSEDMIEGMTAFAEKRTPQWKNR